jgi:two-component system, chemotaxis family, protein-glutamate methylesterase/glutaminase
MPQGAMQHVRIDHVLRTEEIAPVLVRLAATEADAPEGETVVAENVRIEVNIARQEQSKEAGVLTLGEPSAFACPECHGVLLEMKDRPPRRFRCHTGHAYTLESLLCDMDEAIEDSLWSAIRALEERVMLVSEADLGGAEETQRRADAVRKVVMDRERKDGTSG